MFLAKKSESLPCASNKLRTVKWTPITRKARSKNETKKFMKRFPPQEFSPAEMANNSLLKCYSFAVLRMQ